MASLTIAAVSPYPSIVSVMGQSLSSSFALFSSRCCPRLQRTAPRKDYRDLCLESRLALFASVQVPVRRNFGAARPSSPAFSEAKATPVVTETKPLKSAKLELSTQATNPSGAIPLGVTQLGVRRLRELSL